MPYYNQAHSTSRYRQPHDNRVTDRENGSRSAIEPKAPIIFGRDMDHAAAHTPWPRFGRIRFNSLNETRFTADLGAPEFAGGFDVYIYMAGCKGLLNKAQAWKLPLFKIGVSALPDLLIRQRDLQSDSYGSSHYENGHLVHEEGWNNWEMRQLELTQDPDPLSPVRAVARGLRVRLPVGYASEDFDKALHQKLLPCSLHAFARSMTGRNHFDLLGIEPSSVPRYVQYRFGEGVRCSLANEIYICRPREDWSRLRIIAEELVSTFQAERLA